MKKSRRKALTRMVAGFVFFTFALAPVRLDFWLPSLIKAADGSGIEIIDSDTIWSGQKEVTEVVKIKNNATVTIEPGTRLTFRRDDERVALPGFVVEEGNIVAGGTVASPIVFDARGDQPGFKIIFQEEGLEKESFFRYVTFEKGGGQEEAVIGGLKDRLMNKAQAFIYDVPTLQYQSGKVHIENSRFIDGQFVDVMLQVGDPGPSSNDDFYSKDNYLEIVNSNFEEGEDDAVWSDLQCMDYQDFGEMMGCLKKLTLNNNYYDSFEGPRVKSNPFTGNLYKDGKTLQGQFYFTGLEEGIVNDFWRTKDLIADPVVIIPGIMGSAKKNGKWLIDPILHIYDDLLESLQRNGFEEDKNLFTFPYDWRKSNLVTEDYLAGRLLQIKNITLVSQVDLIGHSMGGLLARAYVQGDHYNGLVDQLIALGTPHRGAPEAYLKWEAGEGFFRIKGKLMKHHFKNEAEHNGYTSIFDYVRNEVPSVKELVPDYDYLYDLKEKRMRNYPSGYPDNPLLDQMNQEAALQELESVELINIIGEVSEKVTISKIRVEPSSVVVLWEHGIPENFYDENTDQGLEYDKGDETVPSSSALGIPADKKIKKDSSHSKLPTKAQCNILWELSRKGSCEYINKVNSPSVGMFNVFSPVDIQVVAPDGKRVGKNFDTGEEINEIEGAFYSGSQTESEFVTVPNPIDGDYQVLTQGTGEGEFRVEVTSIRENEETGEVTEKTKSIESTTTEGETQSEIVPFEEGQVVVEEDDIPPVITINQPEEGKEYRNDQKLAIDFEVSDNVSPLDSITINQKMDGNVFVGEEMDFSLMSLGEHSFSVDATDEAGNSSGAEANFELFTDLNGLTNNIKYYDELGMFEKKWQKRYFVSHLKRLKRLVKHRKIMEKCLKYHKRKERILKRFDRLIERRIDTIAWIIKKHEKKGWIEELAGEKLAEGLKHLKDSPDKL